MRGGFTLLEVLIALLILEIAVLGVLGTVVVTGQTLGRAALLERAVAKAEGVVDSLDGAATLESGERAFADGEVAWTVTDSGLVVVRVVAPEGDTLVDVSSVLRRP